MHFFITQYVKELITSYLRLLFGGKAGCYCAFLLVDCLWLMVICLWLIVAFLLGNFACLVSEIHICIGVRPISGKFPFLISFALYSYLLAGVNSEQSRNKYVVVFSNKEIGIC